MFFLHLANRTESLLAQLAAVLDVDRRDDIFAPELFIIQSQGMERMVCQYLTETFAVFCNFKFYQPVDFLLSLAIHLGVPCDTVPFQRESLVWRLEGLLQEIDGNTFPLLSHYLSGESQDKKRFQLARRLANLFDQYQMLRAEMLDRWAAGQHFGKHVAEDWQMHLWRRLLDGMEPGQMHRGQVFRRLIEYLSTTHTLPDTFPKRVSIIGLHTMPPVFLECFNVLAQHADIHLYLLSPCRHYWGDMETGRKRWLQQLSAMGSGDLPHAGEHHPLLVAYGRQGRDFQEMFLAGIQQFHEFDGSDEPLSEVEYNSASLLHRVQNDLLENRLPINPTLKNRPLDNSITVVACHSRLRELQVLKDHLLFHLHNDQGLDLAEIVVMAPDIQEYAPLIPAVFNDLQHSIADRSSRQRNKSIATFLAFLDLFSGRFGWREVFDVLRQSNVFSQFSLTPGDLELLEHWIVDVGIRWGLSAEQKTEDGLPGLIEGSWRAGIDRLLMGYAIDSEAAIADTIPYPGVEGQMARPLGGLCSFTAMLEQARGDLRQPHDLAGWSTLLLGYSWQLLGEGDDPDLLELRGILSELQALSQLHRKQISFAVIHEWLATSCKERRSSAGFLRGQLTFCSMLPMRSIPFRIVCLLGLNDGEFPREDRFDTFDLMAESFKPGDRSPRADDRYQFLEAILAARSSLYLSYIGQSRKSGDALPPSVLLSEFLELLTTWYGVRDLVTFHPLHPFSKKYFNGTAEQRLFSYHQQYCRVAQTIATGIKEQGVWWHGRVATEASPLTVDSLFLFAANPQRFFLRDILKVRLESTPLLPDEAEPFAVSGLEKYILDQRLIEERLKGRSGDVKRRLQVSGRWPLGTPGDLTFDSKMQELDGLFLRVQALGLGEPLPPVVIDQHLGGYQLIGSLPNLYTNGQLLLRYGRLRGSDVVKGWLLHQLAASIRPTLPTAVVTAEATVLFKGEKAEPTLIKFFDLYREARCRPIPLFFEPSLAYALKVGDGGDHDLGLQQAVARLEKIIEDGYELSFALLYQGLSATELFDEEAQDLCRDFFCRIWGDADVT